MDTQTKELLEQLRDMDTLFVGEVKPRSPYTGTTGHSNVELLERIEPYVDILAIHTSGLWGGSFEWLEEAGDMTDKPILAKGFHPTIIDVDRCFHFGASYVMTVDWYPKNRVGIWYECSTLEALSKSPAGYKVWNHRDPRTGLENEIPFSEAVDNSSGWICQASGITKMEDIHPDADAVLVGQAICV